MATINQPINQDVQGVEENGEAEVEIIDGFSSIMKAVTKETEGVEEIKNKEDGIVIV
jgi:hypothetical protein